MKKLGSILVAVTLLLGSTGAYASPLTPGLKIISNPTVGPSGCPGCQRLDSLIKAQYGSVASFESAKGIQMLNSNGTYGSPVNGYGWPSLFRVDDKGNVQHIAGGAGTVGDGDTIFNQVNQLQQTSPSEAVICVVPKPGQTEENGGVTDEPQTYKPLGPVQDQDIGGVGPNTESDVNFELRKNGSTTQQEEVKRAMSQPVQNGKPKLATGENGPTTDQANQYNASLKGKDPSKNAGTYKINGVTVTAGKKYTAGVTGTDGITFDKDCQPTQGAIPPNNPLGDWGQGGNPGNGNGFGGGGNGGGGLGDGQGGGLGGGGGLGQLLGPLLQGLLGGGGQGGQGLFGQNPYGQNPNNPYGNQYNPYGQQQTCNLVARYPVCGTDGQTYENDCYLFQSGPYSNIRHQGACSAETVPILQQDCTRIATLPVCGKDGKTYNNSCYMRQAGTTRENEGVCRVSQASPKPVVTTPSTSSGQANPSTVLNQITISGIPSELVEAVREAVSRALSTITSGGTVGETVVR